jgi:hypothetical protein
MSLLIDKQVMSLSKTDITEGLKVLKGEEDLQTWERSMRIALVQHDLTYILDAKTKREMSKSFFKTYDVYTILPLRSTQKIIIEKKKSKETIKRETQNKERRDSSSSDDLDVFAETEQENITISYQQLTQDLKEVKSTQEPTQETEQRKFQEEIASKQRCLALMKTSVKQRIDEDLKRTHQVLTKTIDSNIFERAVKITPDSTAESLIPYNIYKMVRESLMRTGGLSALAIINTLNKSQGVKAGKGTNAQEVKYQLDQIFENLERNHKKAVSEDEKCLYLINHLPSEKYSELFKQNMIDGTTRFYKDYESCYKYLREEFQRRENVSSLSTDKTTEEEPENHTYYNNGNRRGTNQRERGTNNNNLCYNRCGGNHHIKDCPEDCKRRECEGKRSHKPKDCPIYKERNERRQQTNRNFSIITWSKTETESHTSLTNTHIESEQNNTERGEEKHIYTAVDSCSSQHVMTNKKAVDPGSLSKTTAQLFGLAGKPVMVTEKGAFTLTSINGQQQQTTLTARNCMRLGGETKMPFNLLSSGQMLDQGVSTVLTKNQKGEKVVFLVQGDVTLNHNKIIAKGEFINNLPMIKQANPKPKQSDNQREEPQTESEVTLYNKNQYTAHQTKPIPMMTLHRKYGHANMATLRAIINAQGITIKGSKELHCSACKGTKMRREQRGKSNDRSPMDDPQTKPGESLHLDIQPLSEPLPGGIKFVGYVTDYKSRKRWTFFWKDVKMETIIRDLEYVRAFTRTQINTRVKSLRADGQFFTEKIKQWTDTHGIERKITPAYTAANNPLSESNDHSIRERANASMVSANLPYNTGLLALRYTTDTANRTPNAALGYKIPDEVYFDRKVKTGHFRTFGCRAIYYDARPRREGKLGTTKGREGIFVGYDSVKRTWKILDEKRNKIISPARVHFYEQERGSTGKNLYPLDTDKHPLFDEEYKQREEKRKVTEQEKEVDSEELPLKREATRDLTEIRSRQDASDEEEEEEEQQSPEEDRLEDSKTRLSEDEIVTVEPRAIATRKSKRKKVPSLNAVESVKNKIELTENNFDPSDESEDEERENVVLERILWSTIVKIASGNKKEKA